MSDHACLYPQGSRALAGVRSRLPQGLRFAALAAFAALTAMACTSQPHEQPAEARGDVIPEMSSSEPTPALNDPTIVAIFDAANTADMETGQLGAERGTTKEVRDLGAMLVHDHRIVRQQARDLAQRLGVVPTPPADDASAMAHAGAMATLRSKQGTEFDRAFLDHEIRFHANVINAVQSTLLPAIQNGELKGLVVKLAPAFDAHRIAAANLRKTVGT
jgi:putative membrane protein